MRGEEYWEKSIFPFFQMISPLAGEAKKENLYWLVAANGAGEFVLFRGREAAEHFWVLSSVNKILNLYHEEARFTQKILLLFSEKH